MADPVTREEFVQVERLADEFNKLLERLSDRIMVNRMEQAAFDNYREAFEYVHRAALRVIQSWHENLADQLDNDLIRLSEVLNYYSDYRGD